MGLTFVVGRAVHTSLERFLNLVMHFFLDRQHDQVVALASDVLVYVLGRIRELVLVYDPHSVSDCKLHIFLLWAMRNAMAIS